MPRPPAPHAHRGTAFHRWLEERFGPQRLLDPSDLPGAADDEPGEVADPELTVLQQRFGAGEWAGRWPSEVEVPFETLIGDRLVRGRIDAVFADSPDGGFDVVDWKTGRQPRAAAESRAVAVQLAAYRIAWAALAGVEVGQVRAAFYYVRDDATVRPADLLDLARVDLDPAEHRPSQHGQLDVLSDEAPQHVFHSGHDVVQIDDPRLEDLLPPEGEQLASEVHRALAGSLDLEEVGAPRIARGHVLRQQAATRPTSIVHWTARRAKSPRAVESSVRPLRYGGWPKGRRLPGPE